MKGIDQVNRPQSSNPRTRLRNQRASGVVPQDQQRYTQNPAGNQPYARPQSATPGEDANPYLTINR